MEILQSYQKRQNGSIKVENRSRTSSKANRENGEDRGRNQDPNRGQGQGVHPEGQNAARLQGIYEINRNL